MPGDELFRLPPAYLPDGRYSGAKQDLGPVLAHAHQIEEERFRSGYDLSEAQTAFNAVEAAVWARVFDALRPDKFAHTLGLVSTILGAAKDGLARKYVSLATEAHAPSLDLGALFAGTDGAPDSESAVAAAAENP